MPIFSLLVILIGTWLMVSRNVHRRLENAIDEANRDDPHWQIDDLMAHREPVADAENGALVVADALLAVPDNWPAPPRPAPDQPNPPQAPIKVATDKTYQIDGNVRLDDETIRVIKEELALYDPQVKQLRTVANFRRGRHELTLGPKLIDTPLNETQKARDAARLLQFDALIRAHEGDYDGALESCRAILGVARSIGDEPFLISHLVRIAIDTVAISSARRVLGQGEPSEAALAKFQADLETERRQPLLVQSMRAERATLTELIRRVGTGEIPFSDLASEKPGRSPDRNQPRKPLTPWARLWLENQRAIGIEWMNRAVEIAKRPSHERAALFDKFQAEQKVVKTSRMGPYTATLPMLLMPALWAGAHAQTRLEAEAGAAILLFAAERQRRQTGEWPKSIESIDRAFLSEPLFDPNTGKPYRMKSADGRIVFYSVGKNLQDEAGEYDPKKWNTNRLDDVNALGWDVDRRAKPGP